MIPMNTIVIKSFWSSGGSAVNDYLSEFNCCVVFNEQEFILFEALDGLVDLELRVKCNRNLIATGCQISRFARLSKVLSRYGLYSKPYDSKYLFDGYFKKRTDLFLKDISIRRVKASIAMDWHLVNEFIFLLRYKIVPRIFIETVYRVKKFFISYVMKKLVPRTNYHPQSSYYIPNASMRFDSAVTKYVNDLFAYLKNKKDNVGKHLVLDQMLNIDNYFMYKDRIQNLKFIVVDRDPRDIYLSLLLKWKTSAVPHDVKEFVEWFRAARASLHDYPNADYLYIRFEDLVYNYKKTSVVINNYLGLSSESHCLKKKLFDPEISIKNTQIFNKVSGYDAEINYIEKNLSEYLYDFVEVDSSPVKDIF